MMSAAEWHLARWREAGLIDGDLRRRILDYEAGAGRSQPGARADGPSAGESFIYLGFAVAFAGVVALTSQHWQALGGGARLTILAVAAALALLAGALMRRAIEAWQRRGAGVAWLLAVVLLGGAAGVAGDNLGVSARSTTLGAALLMMSASVLLWWAQRARPQLVALAGTVVFLAEGIALQWRPDHPELAGALILAGGAAGVALVENGLLIPDGIAGVLAALLMLVGALHIQLGNSAVPWALPALGAGGALVVLSVLRSRFDYVVVGVLTLFCSLVAFTFQHFEHSLGVPLSLLFSGGLLVAAVLLTAAARRSLTRHA